MASLIEKKVEHKNSFQPKETKEKIAISEKQENIAIAKKVAEAVDNDKVKKKEKIAKAFVEKKDETQEKPVKKIKSVQKGVKEKQTNVAKWLLKQPKQYFTMQVASLSTQKSVLAFLKKHSSLKDKLKYLKVGSLDKKRYIVLYGSFKNSALALKAKKTLPPEFKKSWVRRFGSLQKMVKK